MQCSGHRSVTQVNIDGGANRDYRAGGMRNGRDARKRKSILSSTKPVEIKQFTLKEDDS